jgi:hypothetical protein
MSLGHEVEASSYGQRLGCNPRVVVGKGSTRAPGRGRTLAVGVGAVVALSSCADLSLRDHDAVGNYVRVANAWMERCSPEASTENRRATADRLKCVEDARADTEAARLRAERFARLQRGTRLYLHSYEADWNLLMACSGSTRGSAKCAGSDARLSDLRSSSEALGVNAEKHQ